MKHRAPTVVAVFALSLLGTAAKSLAAPVQVGSTSRITLPAAFVTDFESVLAPCVFVDQNGTLAGDQVDVAAYQNGAAVDVMTTDVSGCASPVSLGASQSAADHGTVQGSFVVQGIFHVRGLLAGVEQALWTPRFNSGLPKTLKKGLDEGLADGDCGLVRLPGGFNVPGVTFVDQDPATAAIDVEGRLVQGLGTNAERLTLSTDSTANGDLIVLGRTATAGTDGRLDGRCFNIERKVYFSATTTEGTRRLYTPKFNNGSSSGFDYVDVNALPVVPVLEPGAIAHWRGQGNANDAVGEHDGVASVGVSYAAGKVGQAFVLDPLDEGAVEVAYAADLDALGSSFTLALWLRADAGNALDSRQALLVTPHYGLEVFEANDAAIGVNFYVATTASGDPLYVGDGQGGGVALADPEAWNHVAATYDGAELKLYVNGLLALSREQGGSLRSMRRSDRLSIGSGAGLRLPGEAFFDGALDDLVIFAHALSAEEIQGLYQRSNGGN